MPAWQPKWAFSLAGETLVDRAIGLLHAYARGDLRFGRSRYFLGGIRRYRVERRAPGPLATSRAEKAVSPMLERKFPTVSSVDLLPAAFAIAVSFDRTVYDGLYVALTISAKAPLFTADERLANALSARFEVKWLGAIGSSF